ncbi:acyl-CoA dehydrogenase C-terminal domain-containing protein [Roseisolibacter sp. H3M3-2]|uniref:acyl-CoA dehydrogenase C-terminal domain-containing protein n=1 Tax=Roseisolibacter sp. H3M3-2 TaxID=3031323 RepID=UPI0023DC90DC|nr:acyl-CoA dehydrogenase C-terminal domain-containing protein [Roseisolibacter sp. H3M3-2]MDF1503006.1 acyl-CoA dehydrogenase C-terminal domain-containing protein [Roseisolibacter sp. H3M3-2]
MPTYKAPLDDIRFLLTELLDVEQLSKLPGYEEATPDVLLAVLEEGAKLCEDVLAPINQSGDAEGCRYENGVVTTPKGFKEAYAEFVKGGWPAMTAPAEFGGQGLPHLTRFVLNEMMCAANLSFAMYPELGHGVAMTLEKWGNEELKHRFMPKIVDGTWTGTMCLTEPHAGTDLGIIRTKAVPAGDGVHELTGTKIFISAGDHDLAENVVHLVLAKLPDAPAGTKGISMFIVPKFLPTEEGGVGTANGVTCGSIEHKMGIKGNATCVINFDGAKGWLVGDEHKGMRAMFTMMNGARLGVGLQGLGLAEVAYQNALAYTKDRVQGRALTGKKAPEQEADPIIVHPDVRKMLLTQKAYVEGERALAYWVGQLIDVEEKHPDAEKRQEASDLVALMTPIIKGFLTDTGFESANLALQCLGGHGYVREYGLEQFVRDARIAQIYEGTNGVQALDLIGRKVPEGNGRLLRRFLTLVQADVKEAQGDPRVAEHAAQLADAVRKTQESIMTVMQKAMQNPDEAGAASTDFLRMMGLVATGWMWLKMARLAHDRLAAGGDARFYDAKVKTARFYFAKLLPQVDALAVTMKSGAAPLMELEAAAF